MENNLASTLHVSTKVKPCRLCTGAGSYVMNSIHSFYDEELVVCWVCKGSGKIIETTEYVLKVREEAYVDRQES